MDRDSSASTSAKAWDANAEYTIRSPSPLVGRGAIMELLGRFLETTVKNWYPISAFASAAKGAALAPRDFLSYGA